MQQHLAPLDRDLPQGRLHRTARCRKRAAKCFFKKWLKGLRYAPRAIITDKPRRIRYRREGAKAVRDTFAPIRGLYPDADWPLAVWQIDHTPADLILV